jgi:hypothetical protein
MTSMGWQNYIFLTAGQKAHNGQKSRLLSAQATQIKAVFALYFPQYLCYIKARGKG